jgi:hypothetical protein
VQHSIIDGLRDSIKDALQNAWFIDCPPDISGEVTVFSDASDLGFGAVFSVEETMLDQWRGEFHPRWRGVHIFIKEMAAAVWAITRGIRTRHWRKQRIRLVVDNSAVAFAIRMRHSSNEVARRWLQKLHGAVTEAECTLNVVCQVASIDNPADEPSRGKLVDLERLLRGWRAAKAYEEGRLISTSNQPWAPSEGDTSDDRIRHGETDMQDWMEVNESSDNTTVLLDGEGVSDLDSVMGPVCDQLPE